MPIMKGKNDRDFKIDNRAHFYKSITITVLRLCCFYRSH